VLYLFSTAWIVLVVINFFGGVIWAGLSLGLQNYVFDVVDPGDRAKAVAVVSVANSCGWAAGTLVGSWLIATVPATLQLGTWVIHPVSNLPFIFCLSGLLRLLVSSSLLGTFTEPRQIEQRTRRGLIWELPLLKPLSRMAVRRLE